MTNSGIPRALPDCELLQVLAEKASRRHDIDFNFLARLDEFRQRVSGEVRQINVLFPEYTPHDEQYHLKRLFHVACTVLGRDRLEIMNSAELCVLAVALYGHDWGMAVSEPEKRHIVTGELSNGAEPGDLWLLPDERRRFTAFARKQRLAIDAKGYLKDIPIEMWREYVRQTHAFRSGERVRRFFEPIDRGVAEAASRVCEGHWLSFEELREYRSYPPDFAVLRETVNVRALAVYLRLIDLLDLAEDRTPYVIWKFVAPRDPCSRIEWAKHRALQPVTCPSYQEGRIILVDGSTDDHEVYAALEDLRIYCEEQLRGCNDLLARMNDPRHRLDLYHIDWRVRARGFKPVLIQFEFDRERMFDILGSEIYQSDPYVFLRELLQNSIDAIRMRREILQRKRITPGDLGVIRVTVQHGEAGDAIVTWHDDGIGMDEYIVRNYLAAAGKSYYHSPDFEREGLELDPISRFGIGTLSCFMVADHIEIETFKDPYLPPPGEPLRIDIPTMHRQFRIEVGTRETAEVGTTFRIFVNGYKLPVDKESKSVKPLDVTAYLSIVGGFVEFPIVINERDRKTIILHPKQDAEAARRRFGEEYEVHQLDLDYPWSDVFPLQDLSAVRELFQEKSYDLPSDLNLEGYDGAFVYLVPANDQVVVGSSHTHYGDEGGSAVVRKRQERHAMRRIRWFYGWGHYQIYKTDMEVEGISRSATHPPACAVYRDGILLPSASPPLLALRGSKFWGYTPDMPLPKLVVNLPKSQTARVDLARMQILDESEHWAVPILRAHLHRLSETLLSDLLVLDPDERLYQLARLAVFHRITFQNLTEVFPRERWPLPFLESGGKIVVLEWQDVAADAIGLTPSPLETQLLEMACCRWLTKEQYTGPLVQWSGERSLISGFGWNPDQTSLTLAEIEYFCKQLMRPPYYLDAIQFLTPPREGDPPLLRKVYRLVDVPHKLPQIEAILEQLVEDPRQLNPVTRNILATLRYPHHTTTTYLPMAIEFPAPFEQSFAYGWQVLNLRHPVAQALIRIAAAVDLARRHEVLSEAQIASLEDALRALQQPNILSGESPERFEESDSRFEGTPEEWVLIRNNILRVWSLVRELQPFGRGEPGDVVLVPEDFVPGTVLLSHDDHQTRLLRHFQLANLDKDDIHPFGELLE